MNFTSKKPRKLALNKETLRNLTSEDLGNVNGGFTYSLSTGDRCQKSHDFTDGHTCKCNQN